MGDFTLDQYGRAAVPNARRRLAQALMMQGGDASPVQSPWQGLDRVAKALLGAKMSSDEDSKEKAGYDLLLSNPALMGGSPAAPVIGGPSGPGDTAVPPAAADTIDPTLKDAINNVATARGVDPEYMTRLAMVENDGKVNGGSTLSSAQGPFQFLKGTARQYGLANPNDPTDSADAAARFTLDNKAALTQALGREPTPGELYLAHQQGATGAAKLLANPDAPVESVIGAQAARNNGATPGMTAGQFANKWTGRFSDIGAPQTVAANAPSPLDNAQYPAGPVGASAAVVQTGAQLPTNAQPTQGFAVPGTSPVVAPPQIPPATSEYIRKLIVNPYTRNTGIAMLSQYSKPRETHSQMTDDAGNIWDVNQQTGQRTLALKKDKVDTPTSVQEFNFYRNTFQPSAQQPQPMDYSTWATSKARAGAMTVNNNVGGGSDKQIFDEFSERSKEARSAATGLVALRNARGALQGDGGAVTGFGANQRLALQKAGAYLGVTDPTAIQNTETFRAAIAPQVAATLRATVGTNQISNSDREFAEKASGGSITLDSGSINRLLGIMERAAVARLQQHQEQLDAVYPDPVANRRERALFGVQVPTSAAPPAGATKSGIKWSVE